MRRVPTLALIAVLVSLAACRGDGPDRAERAGGTGASAAPTLEVDATGPTASATGATATDPTAVVG